MNIVDNLQRYTLFLGVASSPIYVFPSGSMQPSHMFLATFMLLCIFTKKFNITNKWCLKFIAFVIYIFIIETFYTIVSSQIDGMVQFLFFLFNLMLTISLYSYLSNKTIDVFINGIIASCGVAIIGLIINGVSLTLDGDGGRGIGTFNNPNQLGYYAVCLGSVVFFLYLRNYLSYAISSCVILVTLILSISSLSKAAMVANSLLLCLLFAPRKVKAKNIVLFLCLTISLLMSLILLYQADQLGNFRFYVRLSSMLHEEDSSLESRGYFVLKDSSLLEIIFGLGLSKTNLLLGHEVHSSFGAVFANYGLVGFFLFFALMFSWCFRLFANYGVIAILGSCMPVILYGLTHNGLRFTMFWLLIGLTIGFIKNKQRVLSRNY